MSEENESSVESTESQSTEPASTEAQTPEPSAYSREAREQREQNRDAKPAGYDPVDPATASPEEVKQRLDYLYRQVKNNERTSREERQILAEQSRLINELTSGFNGVVSHLQDKTIGDNEAQLNQAMREAWEKGDNRAYIEAQDKLTDLKLEKKLLARQRPQQVQQTQQQNVPQYNSAADVARNAVQGDGLSNAEVRTTASWQEEKDDSGNLLRPWAFSSSPDHKQALAEAQAVFNNSRFAHLPYEQKLQEIDRRMGIAKRSVSQGVMGGNLTNARKNSKITLSPEMQKLAIRTKFGGPKAKTEAEHIEAYRKQIERVRQTRGARQ